MRQTDQLNTLAALGICRPDAEALRRISMRLQHWYELECGNGNEWGAWAIERDEETDIPYMVTHHYRHGQATMSAAPKSGSRPSSRGILGSATTSRPTRAAPLSTSFGQAIYQKAPIQPPTTIAAFACTEVAS